MFSTTMELDALPTIVPKQLISRTEVVRKSAIVFNNVPVIPEDQISGQSHHKGGYTERFI